MRYKELISRKIEQLDTNFQQLDYLINTNEAIKAKQYIEGMRERLADIQTLINTED